MVPNVLEEAGAMGAAVTAGVGVGIYKDFHAIDSFIERQYITREDLDKASFTGFDVAITDTPLKD